MCGITGFLSFNNTAGRFDSGEAIRRMKHRGPDGDGCYSNDRIVLGHTRLSIIDLERGDQPLFNENRDIVLITNGEIYNYGGLRSELRSRGHIFATRSDAEVIIHLYEEGGIDSTLSALNGMFAFALWDKKQDMLYIARGRLGIKPVYYAFREDGLLFGSEIKSITAFGDVGRYLRKDSLFEYFTRHGLSGSRTLFADIERLQPAHYLACGASGNITFRRYWEATSLFYGAPMVEDEDEILDRLDKELKRSVDYRVISDVPIGCMLSGGIDSSLLLAYLAGSDRPNARQARVFNAKNVGADIDESPYAQREVAFLERLFGCPIAFTSFVLDNASFLRYFPYLSYIYDEPIQFEASGFLYDICRHARSSGVKVLIAGEGSDELFFGYDRYVRTLRHIESAVYSDYSESELIYYGGGIDNVSLVERLTMTPRDAVAGLPVFRWLERHKDIEIKSRMMLYDITFRLESLLMRMDRMGMAAGVEVRVPFLDHSLVQI